MPMENRVTEVAFHRISSNVSYFICYSFGMGLKVKLFTAAPDSPSAVAIAVATVGCAYTAANRSMRKPLLEFTDLRAFFLCIDIIT